MNIGPHHFGDVVGVAVVGVAVGVQPEVSGRVEADGDLGLLVEAEVVVADVLRLGGGEGLGAAVDVGAGVVAHARLCSTWSN